MTLSRAPHAARLGADGPGGVPASPGHHRAAYEPVPVLQGTPAWLEARRGLVTASNVPVITGNSPYRSSPFDLWAVMTGRARPAPVDPMTQELFDLGHALEPVIAERYTMHTGRPLRRARRLLVSRRVAWAGASLDRVSAVRGERRIVEVKWVPWRRWEEGPEPVPAYVQDQVQWQLMVKGDPVADVAVLNGSSVSVHEIASDPDYQANLVTICEAFYRGHVLTGIPPAVDGSEATRRALLRIWPDDDGTSMEPTAELHALMAELRGAAARLKAADEEDGRLRNAIRLLMEQHAETESDSWSVKAEAPAWRVSYRKEAGKAKTDWKAVAGAYRKRIEQMAAGDPAHDFALDDELDAIEGLHTAKGEGSRTLRPHWRGGDEAWT